MSDLSVVINGVTFTEGELIQLFVRSLSVTFAETLPDLRQWAAQDCAAALIAL